MRNSLAAELTLRTIAHQLASDIINDDNWIDLSEISRKTEKARDMIVAKNFTPFNRSAKLSKTARRLTRAFTCVIVFFSASITHAMADSSAGSQTFQSKCSGCHSIGKGPLVGPDLAGTKSWDDAKLLAAIKRMEGSVGPLAENEISELLAFLKNPESVSAVQAKSDETSKSTAKSAGETAATNAKASSLTEVSQKSSVSDNSNDEIQLLGSALDGEKLFNGRKPFSNGGMACNACHIAGNTRSGLGPDLSRISEKMNDKALFAACQQTPFKVMKTAYANHPVNKEEAASLVKFFDSLKNQQAPTEKFSISACGAGGALFILLLIATGYRNRNNGVRNKLHRR